MDKDVTLAAIKQTGAALQYVGVPLMADTDVCIARLQQDSVALQFVPERLEHRRTPSRS